MFVLTAVYYNPQLSQSDVILQGYGYKMGSGIFSKWEKKYFMLYPNRIDFGDNLQVLFHDCMFVWLLLSLVAYIDTLSNHLEYG